MSQEPIPELKPDFSVKVWGIALTASGIQGIVAGLLGLAMVLTFVVVIKGLH